MQAHDFHRFFVGRNGGGKRLGGHYTSGADWSSHVVVDAGLITGQNPASSEAAAQKLLEALRALSSPNPS